MKITFFILLLCSCFVCKSQDTIRYAVNGSTETRLIKMKDSVSINIFSKEKNLKYTITNLKLSFKKYDMKILKTIKDTVVSFPKVYHKNPVIVFRPITFSVFSQADALTISAGDVIKKTQKGKTETIVNVFGREKELQIVK
ncbi:MAG: hypothetical protein ABIQ07_07615 [Ginsengibacter sp.]